MEKIALILCVIFAVVTIQTQKLRRAVIYLGVFSLSISFVYTLYNALDVAIAEAVIGSTLATILFLVALQKYLVFTIYYHVEKGEVDDGHYKKRDKQRLMKQLEIFCAKQELEPQVIFTTESIDHIMKNHQYAIIIEELETRLRIYGHPENYKLDQLETYLINYIHQNKSYEFIHVKEVIE
ncbi:MULTISPECIES: DUF4040 domain-containing protein [unclassified Fusibacter]|uniref:Na(+)/H(+) antiporter subunit B n=1 Tax=unclassified Fusibacter TaxID=2624464 RepID=UPI0010123F8A|nr:MULTISPECIES: DUF4040 domain-containing protein [unclassified Fusibacter]MCK8059654.1 DUF4040 domain-containing protein [Fusibacter sp. A2]NPE21455.1 DUF4040 domain-containing protein [Fusibacter sp. A1]RXV61866.1 DUF4040 domain-containing protein [Fusibacter sp. A1]